MNSALHFCWLMPEQYLDMACHRLPMDNKRENLNLIHIRMDSWRSCLFLMSWCRNIGKWFMWQTLIRLLPNLLVLVLGHTHQIDLQIYFSTNSWCFEHFGHFKLIDKERKFRLNSKRNSHINCAKNISLLSGFRVCKWFGSTRLLGRNCLNYMANLF